MSSVDDACCTIKAVLFQLEKESSSCIFFKTKILDENCNSMQTEEIRVSSSRFSRSLGFEKGFAINDAVIFLRDEILRTTGRRIWGLTFTLYPDGKYDYNKPDDYDDSDEADDDAVESPVADLLGGLVKRPAAVNPNPFLQQALEALQAQTAQNSQDWGLGSEAQWNLEMNEGTLRFTFADGRVLQAPVQVVGTYNTANGSFLWGWDHSSVPQPLRRAAQKVYDHGLSHALEPLTTRSIACSEDEAWCYTAAAAQLDGAAGAYRGDAGGTWVYMVFGAPGVASE